MSKTLNYCSVFFGGNRGFYYLTKDDTIKVKDKVCVPFGDENKAIIGTVINVAKCDKNNEPVPSETLKYIIKKI